VARIGLADDYRAKVTFNLDPSLKLPIDTTASIVTSGVLGDRYVSLGEPVTADGATGAWGVRIYVKPFVDWIWGGCLLMALGGIVAVSDRRYRFAVRAKAASAVTSARAA